jgi:hypothetical protein
VTVLLLLWVALIGADRINLLGAHSAFVLSPFLLLTPMVFLGELVRRHRAGSRITLSRSLLGYVVLALLLLSLCLASVFVSRDLNSAAPRAVLLTFMLTSSFGVLLVARDRSDLNEVLAKGARWGLFVFALFNAAEVLSWLKIFPEQLPSASGILRLAPDVYGGFVPRLSGMVFDSNRGGLVAVVFAFLVANGDRNRARAWRWVTLAGVLILLTLSRSGILAAAACVAMAAINGASLKLPRRLIALLSVVACAVLTTLLMVPRSRDIASTGIEPILGRLSVVEGSSQDHLRLLERGTSIATESIGAAVHGLGYGSSHTVLQDFFPGDRYGNFHSIYIGIFAESGVFALLTLLMLIGIPLARGGEYRALAASVATFGIFYGALSEPAFWLAITLAWTSLPNINSLPKARVSATAMPRIAPSSS